MFTALVIDISCTPAHSDAITIGLLAVGLMPAVLDPGAAVTSRHCVIPPLRTSAGSTSPAAIIAHLSSDAE